MRVLGAVLLLTVAALASALLLDLHRFYRSPLALSTAQRYVVPSGHGLRGLAGDWLRRGWLREPRDVDYLVALARLQDTAGSIQAGEYRLHPGITAPGLLELLVAGDVIDHAFTIVEGWTFAQLRAALAADPELDAPLPPDAELMRVLGEAEQPPEGLFLPDTYHYRSGASPLDLLRRARQAMRTALQREWAGRASPLPLEAPYQALILASIIEKETGRRVEMPTIAGVFVRRLLRGMRLQTDPTVIYGLGAAFDGNLRRQDLQRDTPYNTYTRHGLPPTPICLPGREALNAALHPADGDALYFVARGDGSHQFSASLEEHNAAVRRYQIRKRP